MLHSFKTTYHSSNHPIDHFSHLPFLSNPPPSHQPHHQQRKHQASLAPPPPFPFLLVLSHVAFPLHIQHRFYGLRHRLTLCPDRPNCIRRWVIGRCSGAELDTLLARLWRRASSLARFSRPVVGALGVDFSSASVSASTRTENAVFVATIRAICDVN